MDDVKILQQLSEVNEEFCQWCKAQYGNDTNGHVKIDKGNVHKYPGMKLDFSIKNKVVIDTESYDLEMVRELRTHLKDNVICPWADKLFNIDKESKYLDKNLKE